MLRCKWQASSPVYGGGVVAVGCLSVCVAVSPLECVIHSFMLGCLPSLSLSQRSPIVMWRPLSYSVFISVCHLFLQPCLLLSLHQLVTLYWNYQHILVRLDQERSH